MDAIITFYNFMFFVKNPVNTSDWSTKTPSYYVGILFLVWKKIPLKNFGQIQKYDVKKSVWKSNNEIINLVKLWTANCYYERKNVCFLGKNEQMIKKEEKVWPKKLLITDMRKKYCLLWCFNRSVLLHLFLTKKKMFDKKKG